MVTIVAFARTRLLVDLCTPSRCGVVPANAVPTIVACGACALCAVSPDDDTYCYELVCMLSSLSDTDAGRPHVAQPLTVGVLVALLPVATPRVQRQVLLILRRVLLFVNPRVLDDKVAAPVGILRDAVSGTCVVLDADVDVVCDVRVLHTYCTYCTCWCRARLMTSRVSLRCVSAAGGEADGGVAQERRG